MQRPDAVSASCRGPTSSASRHLHRLGPKSWLRIFSLFFPLNAALPTVAVGTNFAFYARPLPLFFLLTEGKSSSCIRLVVYFSDKKAPNPILDEVSAKSNFLFFYTPPPLLFSTSKTHARTYANVSAHSVESSNGCPGSHSKSLLSLFLALLFASQFSLFPYTERKHVVGCASVEGS
eukprot:g20107.t1